MTTTNEFPAAYIKAFDRIISHEGGFTRRPEDPGNWTGGKCGHGKLNGTKFGISAATYPDLNILELTLEDARRIYYTDWWVKLNMGILHPAMQYQLFDASINHGTAGSSRILQQAVDAIPDGIIGPKTIAAVNMIGLNDLLLRFLAARLLAMSKSPRWDSFGRGWARRIANNLVIAAVDN